MDLDFLYKLVGIISFVFAGVNFVIIVGAKTFWSLTFKRLETDVRKIDERTIGEQKDNEAFRHKYKTTVEGLVELIKIKFDDLDKNFNRFEELVKTRIDLAISKNNEKK